MQSFASNPARAFAQIPESSRLAARDVMRSVQTLGRIYLWLRVGATVLALTWAIVYTRALWNSKFDKDKRERLTAINDLWMGRRTGVLFALVAHWAFTILVLLVSPLAGTVASAAVEYLRAQT